MDLNIEKIGSTVLGQSIDCWYFNQKSTLPRIFIVGGVHGDESEGIEIANGLIKKLLDTDNKSHSFAIIPCLNRDGESLRLRSNFNDVDLNRNIPTQNWAPTITNPKYKPGPSAGSEPETKAFIQTLNEFDPLIIISLHSYSESLILYGGADGKYNRVVSSLSEALDLKIVEKMSYDVVGSLNTLSKEKQIPTITIEAPRDTSWNDKKYLFIEAISNFMLEIK
jgi:protein MpaA